MTKSQGGMGATPERMAKGNVTVRETMEAGEIAQADHWPDIVAFMVDDQIALLDPCDRYGWTDYCRLRAGYQGSDRTGTGGQGLGYEAWIEFGKIIGHAKLNWLNELWDYPVPAFNKPEQISFTRWRLNRCMDKIRGALLSASEAAQESRKRVDPQNRKQGSLTYPENSLGG